MYKINRIDDYRVWTEHMNLGGDFKGIEIYNESNINTVPLITVKVTGSAMGVLNFEPGKSDVLLYAVSIGVQALDNNDVPVGSTVSINARDVEAHGGLVTKLKDLITSK